MQVAIRIGLVALGLASIGLAFAFLSGVQAIVSLWPYPAPYGLGRVFLASIFAAIGAPIIWIGLSGDIAAVRPAPSTSWRLRSASAGRRSGRWSPAR